MPIIPTLVAQVPMRCPSIALTLNLISLTFLKQQVTTLHFDSSPLFGDTQCHILVFWKWYQSLESYLLNFYFIPNTDKDTQSSPKPLPTRVLPKGRNFIREKNGSFLRSCRRIHQEGVNVHTHTYSWPMWCNGSNKHESYDT